MEIIKPTRGQKVCHKCNTINGVRSAVCKKCSSPFQVKLKTGDPEVKTEKKRRRRRKNKPQTYVVVDWENLIPGQTIKVVGGSGPYYTDGYGNRHYYTDRGYYTVKGIDKQGIHTYNKKSGGYQFLYMGEERPGIAPSNTNAPHKIITLRIDGNGGGENGLSFEK